MAEPLMELRGSKLRTNEFRPNRVFVFQDRIEEHDQGVLKKSMQTIRMDQVAQVKEQVGIKFTTLTIESTGGGQIVSNGLSKKVAAEAKQLIDQLIAQARAPHTPPAPPQVAPPPPASPQPAMLDQLKQLGELRDAGVLTDAEFEEQKALILAQSSGTPAPPQPPQQRPDLPPPPPSASPPPPRPDLPPPPSSGPPF